MTKNHNVIEEIGNLAGPELSKDERVERNNELFMSLYSCDDDEKRDYYRETIIFENIKLAIYIGTKNYRGKLDIHELISLGYDALSEAVDRFVLGKGMNFGCYSTFYIKNALKEAYDTKTRMIRIPITSERKIRRIMDEKKRLEREFGREPTDEEVSKETDLSPRQIANVKDINFSFMPICFKTTDGESSYDIEDDRSDNSLERLATEDSFKFVLNIMKKILKDREYELVIKNSIEKKTLGELHEEYGITPERVRQVISHACYKVRNYIKKNYGSV